MMMVGVEERAEGRNIKIVRICGRVSHVPVPKIIISYHLHTVYMLCLHTRILGG